MKKPRIYLDNCCFNRPFDDQGQLKIFLESQAVDFIQNGIEDGEYHLIWSFILDDENDQNLDYQKRETIKIWKYHAVEDVEAHTGILTKAEEFEELGIKAIDALHLACAVFGKADFFITTDWRLLKKHVEEVTLLNPIDFVRIFERKRTMTNDAVLLNNGMQVLIENLGLTEAERFVVLLKRDRFDYTEWRQTLSEGKTVKEIYERAKKARERRKTVES